MATWYAWIDGREQGPFPPEDMRFLVRTGKITEDTMVRRSDLADSVRAGSVKGLTWPV